MKMTNGEVTEIINKLFHEKKFEEAEQFIRENPNFGMGFIENRTLEINLMLTHINMVALYLSIKK